MHFNWVFMKFNAACIQLCSSSDMAENIAKVETLVSEAARKGAKLIATPENTFLMQTHDAKVARYDQDNHPAVLASVIMARQHQVWLLIGSVAVDGGDKTYNRSLLLNPLGDVVAVYDKIHLFDVEVGDGQTYRESAKMLSGSKMVVADMDGAKLGMSICYDVRFPHLYRAMAKDGAQILSIPAAFTQITGEAHWHILNRARAIENGCFVIAPAQSGTHAGGRETYGHSLIIDPWGRVLADAGVEEGVIVAEIDLDKVSKVRKQLPSLSHDRPFD